MLGLGVLLSLGLASTVRQKNEASAQQAFDDAAHHTQAELLARFKLPVYGLRGLRGSFASVGPLSREQFAHYMASSNLADEFPGILGIAFVQRVQRRDLADFLAATRADKAPGFTIHGLGESKHNDLYIVKYIAPQARNASALGLDIGSDPSRRRAIEQAVRSGQPTMTECILLVQNRENKQPGVLISLPVYANAAPLDTPKQRQAALIGIINTPAVVAGLLDARGDIGHGELHVRLLGPTAPTGSTTPWYDNLAGTARPAAATPHYQRSIPLDLYGQTLELQIASTPDFENLHLSSADWWVMITGLLLSAGTALWLSRHLHALRRADSELELAQRKLDSYRHLAGQTHSAYVATNLLGCITSVSSGFEQLSGYTMEEALGWHPGALLQCEETDPDEVLRIREALRSTGYYVGEILNRSKQGRLYWVELHIHPHFNKQGEQIGFIASSIDVTQRRQSQQLLQEAERSNRNLLDALDHNAIVSFTDLDGVIQRVNSGFCRVSGYSQDELVGKRHNIVNAGADNVVNWGQVWRTIQKGRVWRGEVCNRAKDGRLYWVDTVIVPFLSVKGEVDSYVSVRFEITQLKLTQARAEQQTALLEGAIATIGQAFCIYDADDRLVYFNDQYRQVYARSAAKIVAGETFEAIVRFGAESGQYPEAIGRFDEWVAERLAFHRRGDGELVQHLDDGRILRIIERRMSTGYTVGFRIDITNMVKDKEAAQAGERAKSQFLANMSHEIRTPMNAVLGMLALLRKTSMTAQQSDYAGKAERAGKSLLGLLNDILDLSKIDANMMVLEQRPFEIEHVLRELAEIFASTHNSPRVELLLDLDPGASGSVIGDSLRLHQILLNLGNNAIKFTQEGHVLIGVRVVERAATCLRLLFEVRDTGIGMEASFQRVIFDAFTQAQQSNTRQYGGTGLGMAITSQLVKLMGGELQVESELGRGSRFFFEADLALDPAEPAGPPEVARTGVRWDGLHVLLVDDHPKSRELLERMCHSLGWRATVCDSGAAALALLRDAARQGHHYDVVFMDSQMPDLSGWQTCVQLREWDRGTPVVLMTTLSCLKSLPPGIDLAGLIDGQIMKPVTASMLYDTVANLRGHGEQAAKPPASQAMDDAPLAGLRILLAEDNLVNQQLARELLMHEGAEVDIAANGQLAVEMVQAASPPYDLVLMDMQMPVMDGLEATRKIRESLGLLELPIVAMTANAMSDDRQACLDAGMNEHVAKPLDMDELVDMILRHAPARHAESR
ncbi:response regulator [Malikia sp.]|uniref:PAS domain-containing hybrid sensor histidine kinase/response regulator n=1 Tax=Malikia sp. TaxID=2070706 RepID=UPI00263723F8|nr:response regulator [Malikia sp.]MDD2728702.1 response regulator [Malikia sp.]